jgi:hypothetical protein
VSRTRFGLLLGLLALLVAGGAFLLGLQVLEDDEPDAPPRPAADGSAQDTGDTTSTTASTVPAGELAAPAWIVVVSSEGDEARAGQIAAQVAEAGHESGVLRSDDYPSMNPGYWVAYAGPYPDATAAQAGEAALEGDGWTAAYVRCAGTTEQCGGGGDEGRGGDDSDDDG